MKVLEPKEKSLKEAEEILKKAEDNLMEKQLVLDQVQARSGSLGRASCEQDTKTCPRNSSSVCATSVIE